MGKPLMGEGEKIIKNLFTRLSVNPTPVQGLVSPRLRAAVTQPSRNLPSSFHALTCPLDPTPPIRICSTRVKHFGHTMDHHPVACSTDLRADGQEPAIWGKPGEGDQHFNTNPSARATDVRGNFCLTTP